MMTTDTPATAPTAPSDSAIVITVCDTCRFSKDEERCDGETGGAIFVRHVSAAAASRMAASPGLSLTVRSFSCLMGCVRHCNVALSCPGKITYVLGEFDPTPEAAAAIVEYAALYAESGTGQVPYKLWPQGVKGHFAARVPAPPAAE